MSFFAAWKTESPVVGYAPTIYMEGNLLKRQGVGTSSSRLKSLKFKQQYCRLTSVALEYYERKKDRKVTFMHLVQLYTEHTEKV